MDQSELRQSLEASFRTTAKAHHDAYLETNGEDPDWPIWYADHLREPLSRALHTEFGRAQLIYCLMNADFEQRARFPDADWAEFFAGHFMERYAPSDTPTADRLALYWFPTCPFSRRVVATMDRLGVKYELRDINEDPGHLADLVEARGRRTVPVLRIWCSNGEQRWMPESGDIIQWLESNYGDS